MDYAVSFKASSIRPRFVIGAGLIIGAALYLSLASWASASLLQRYRTVSLTVPLPSRTVAAVVVPAATATTNPAPASTPAPNQASAASSPTSQPPVRITASPVTACTPSSAVLPSALDLTNSPNGVSQQIDGPTQYQIYGNNMTDLRQQIQRCSPARTAGSAEAEYTGQNNYNLSWRYNFRSAGNSCTVTDVKVGLHTSMDMPLWQPTSAAQAGLPAAWNSFVQNLRTHEDGHTVISQQQAQAMVADLQAIGTVNCTDLGQIVKQKTDARMAQLNQAQEAYDAQTNHGASQGAVMPR